MCLIAWRWAPESSTPLVVAANRDEFMYRATAPLQVWSHQGIQVYSGLDLALEPMNGLLGTWSGISATGRFAWLTNIRSPNDKNPDAPSRGHLVSGFLTGQESAFEYISQLRPKANKYNGFNLVLGQLPTPTIPESKAYCWHYNSRTGLAKPLGKGVYGLSNADLDSPWPKTQALVHALTLFGAQWAGLQTTDIDTSALFQALADPRCYPLDKLPKTGVPELIECVLSATFIQADIKGARYGTRSSTVTYVKNSSVNIHEYSFADALKPNHIATDAADLNQVFRSEAQVSQVKLHFDLP